jgi:hypothetical protein
VTAHFARVVLVCLALPAPAQAAPIDLFIAVATHTAIATPDTLQQYNTPRGCRWVQVFIDGQAGSVQWHDITGDGVGDSNDGDALDAAAHLEVQASTWWEHRIPETGYGEQVRATNSNRRPIPIFVAVDVAATVTVQCTQDGD